MNATPLILLCAKKGQTTSLKQARKNKSLEFIKLIDVGFFKKTLQLFENQEEKNVQSCCL